MTAEYGVEKGKVLVVDDNPLNLMLLEEILTGAGHEVRVCLSGREAIRGAMEWKPDLILLDVIMPEMSGFEVCRHLKSTESLAEIPIIFCSALSEVVEKISAFSVGGVDYVTKPFDVLEVLARVGTHLKLAFLQRCLSRQNENLEATVAARTNELAQAHRRLVEIDRLKNEFLLMISHEILTPVNGILGLGEMMLDESSYPPPEVNGSAYREAFGQSLKRLRNLIDDAGLIVRMEQQQLHQGGMKLCDLLQVLRTQLPEAFAEIAISTEAEDIFLNAERSLLLKAMKTVCELAKCFSSSGGKLVFSCQIQSGIAKFIFQLDKFLMDSAQASEFFYLESAARSSSHAERLGLAPVVAKKILTSFCGDLHLICRERPFGELIVSIPLTFS